MGVIEDPRLRVLVVTGDAAMASSTRQVLQVHGADVRPMWTRTAEATLTTADTIEPHVVVSDLTLADMDAESLLTLLRGRFDGLPIVILTSKTKAASAVNAHPDLDVAVCRSVGTLVIEIERALGQPIRGHRCDEPRAFVDSAAWEAAATLTDEVFIGLTPREAQVMSELAHGEDNQTIGEHLGVAASTVSNCLRRLREKLGVSTRGDLIAISTQHLTSR